MSTLNTTGKVLYKKRMRVGRGIGSGKGKTSGRGVNPIKRYQAIIAIMNLEKIQSYIDEKTINSSDIINMALLIKLKLINKNSQKLKILGTGDIKDKVSIEADLISKAAVVKLEKAGGTIQLKK